MTHELLVLGAGYAGLAAARSAARGRSRRDRTDLRITLVNAVPDFVERVRLHQVAVGQDVGVHPLTASLTGTGIDLVVGWIEGWDLRRRVVTVQTEEGPRSLGYDTLVHALGSTASLDTVPGVAEHTMAVADLDGARVLAERLSGPEPPRTMAVVGGGLTGMELATEVAESHPGVRVKLLTRGRVAAEASRKGRAHVLRALDRLGVNVREYSAVAEIEAGGVVLDDGGRVPADLVVWNGGFTPSPLAREAGLRVDERGRALVDSSQRSLSHSDVYVVGDAAHARGVDGGPLRMSCAMGLPMGAAAGKAITARLSGREPAPGPFGYLFQCVSLGRRDGLIQFVHADDSARERVLTGRAAALFKEAIVASARGNVTGAGDSLGAYVALIRRAARRYVRKASQGMEGSGYSPGSGTTTSSDSLKRW